MSLACRPHRAAVVAEGAAARPGRWGLGLAVGLAMVAGAGVVALGQAPGGPLQRAVAPPVPNWTVHLAATDVVRWDVSLEAAAGQRFPLPLDPPGAGPDDEVPGAAAAPTPCGLPALADEVLRRLNELRRQGQSCGRQGRFGPAPELAWNERLEQAATMHAADMAARERFAHDGSDGRTMIHRVERVGYRWRALAENIAAGQPSVPEVLQAFVQSDGHCANLMNPTLRHVALACMRNDGSRYPTWWTMNLAAPR